MIALRMESTAVAMTAMMMESSPSPWEAGFTHSVRQMCKEKNALDLHLGCSFPHAVGIRRRTSDTRRSRELSKRSERICRGHMLRSVLKTDKCGRRVENVVVYLLSVTDEPFGWARVLEGS